MRPGDSTAGFVDGYYTGYRQALAHAGTVPCGEPVGGGRTCYLATGHHLQADDLGHFVAVNEPPAGAS